MTAARNARIRSPATPAATSGSGFVASIPEPRGAVVQADIPSVFETEHVLHVVEPDPLPHQPAGGTQCTGGESRTV